MDLVEVVGQVVDLGDVVVALVAVGDEADLEVGGRLAAGDLVADGPDLGLGPVDQAAHAARRVQAEHHLHLRLLRRGGLVRRHGRQGQRRPRRRAPRTSQRGTSSTSKSLPGGRTRDLGPSIQDEGRGGVDGLGEAVGSLDAGGSCRDGRLAGHRRPRRRSPRCPSGAGLGTRTSDSASSTTPATAREPPPSCQASVQSAQRIGVSPKTRRRSLLAARRVFHHLAQVDRRSGLSLPADHTRSPSDGQLQRRGGHAEPAQDLLADEIDAGAAVEVGQADGEDAHLRRLQRCRASRASGPRRPSSRRGRRSRSRPAGPGGRGGPVRSARGSWPGGRGRPRSCLPCQVGCCSKQRHHLARDEMLERAGDLLELAGGTSAPGSS